MQRVVKAKTRRTKKALEEREGKVFENPKKIIYVHGNKCSQVVQDTFKDMHLMTKPQSVIYSRKHEYRPFEDIVPFESMSDQHDVALFAFGSHSKKRPHNLTFVRMFDHHLLDMLEFGVEDYKAMSTFKNEKNMMGSKPCLVFQGEQFENNPTFVAAKSMLADFFRGPIVDNVNLAGLDHAIIFSSLDDRILMRHYLIKLKKSGSRLPLVDLVEIGPSLAMTVRRTQSASEDLMKEALRVPKQAKVRKVKNIEYNELGDKAGRLHLDKQNFKEMATRKMKGLKRRKADEDKGNDHDDHDDDDVDAMSEEDE